MEHGKKYSACREIRSLYHGGLAWDFKGVRAVREVWPIEPVEDDIHPRRSLPWGRSRHLSVYLVTALANMFNRDCGLRIDERPLTVGSVLNPTGSTPLHVLFKSVTK